MKKMKIQKQILAVCCMLFFVMNCLQAQRSVNTTYFGKYNYIDSYSEDLNVFEGILNTTNSSATTTAKNDLKTQYTAMSGVTISDTDLDAMLDVSQTNYDTWMSVWNDHKDDPAYSESDLYVLRSVIMNLKARM